MLGERDPSHYLRALKTTTTPRRLLWLDCAGSESKERGVFVERWAAGVLGTTHYTSKRNERRDTLTDYADVPKLWHAVDDFCKPGKRVVLFAYDLARQLRVSQALIGLPALGWELDRIVLERTASWALFREGKRTLMCCDLMSWSTADLGRIAADVAGDGLAARTIHAGPSYHANACRYRATVVREAVLQILAWIEAENLGPFRPTGSGQSYSAFRRRFMRHKLLVHDDTERLRIERVAMWTGRCEAWRHGKLEDGPYVEYDMQSAYAHIARDCYVPTVAAWSSDNPQPSTVEKALANYSVMADVTLTTDVPAVPTSKGGRTVWPVGTFRTVLWDPELELAMRYASAIKFHKIYRYHKAPALRDFASWVLDGMDEQLQVYGQVNKRVLKHWSRCMIGRLGLRFRAWEPFGTQYPPDLRLVTFIDVDEGTSTDMLIAGTSRMILADMAESTESLPQVPGWIMSECRRRLWEAMAWVGFDHLAYVDTDSLIFDPGTDKDTRYHYERALPGDWTHKGNYSRMVINGPRNLVAESTRRVSGLPLTARQVAPLEFSGQVMRSIKESMRAGELDCVASIPRHFVLDAPDLRRQHLSGGRTIPYSVTLPKRGD